MKPFIVLILFLSNLILWIFTLAAYVGNILVSEQLVVELCP